MKSFAPQSLLLLATLGMAALTLAAAAVLLRSPWLGLTLEPLYSSEDGLRVVRVHSESPAAGRIAPDDILAWIRTGDAAPLYLAAHDLIADPDRAGRYAEYNLILERQGKLAWMLDHAEVTLGLKNGRQISIRPQRHRPFSSLPWVFWYQVLCAASGFLLAAGVWAFQSRNASVRMYALSGVGLVTAILPAAVFSARELAIDAPVMHVLSVTSDLGRTLFAACIVALLWSYPKRLFRFQGGPLIVTAMVIFWALDATQIFSTPILAARYPLLILLLAGVCLGYLQWTATRRDPAGRLIVNWFILCALLGPGAHLLLHFLPVALNRTPIIPEQVTWGALTLFYFMIALGIVRYKLFQLERWWLAGWTWFLAGAAVIALDIALVFGLSLDRQLSLVLSLALAGFFYFPLRQKILMALPWYSTDSNLLGVLSSAFGTPGRDNDLTPAGWKAVLNRIFGPLEIRTLGETLSEAGLGEDGLTLRVPGFEQSPGLELFCARGGGRLFNIQDVKLVEGLGLLFQRIKVYQNAFADGVQTERARIARDLHDDVSAALLTMVYKSSMPELQEAARAAVAKLRALMSALETGERCLEEITPDWRAEAHDRCATAQVILRWRYEDISCNPLLDSRFQLNLKRLIQEAITNVIRHAHAHEVDVRISAENNRLRVIVTDDGVGFRPDREDGSGMRGMRKRVKELGGEIEWQPAGSSGCRVEWTVPLPG